jgi:hypothetical protein
MARNDGIDRTVARNQDLPTPDDVAKIQEHNEREKDSYSNQDIVPERTSMNVHFKASMDDYVKMFEQMEQDGVISTRGLKPDAIKYGELVFDVNSAYFYNHGGYEFAKQFYADAYKAAVEIVGGEQYILSAVMHADERNRAMSEALGEDVYHYHLHVVYIPVVAQAEQSLEDAKAATEKQKKKLEALQKETKTAKTIALTVQDIEAMGKKATFGNNITLTPDECDTLKRYAVNGIIANADNKRLKEKLASAEKTVSIWKQRYEAVNEKYMELKQKAQPFLDALEIASEKVRAFINSILTRGKETQEHKAPAHKRGQDMEI